MDVSTTQRRIAELARIHVVGKGRGLDNLHPFLTVELLRTAFRRLRKDGAPGIDGQTLADYAGDGFEDRLVDLLDRAKSGRYRAPPVRRTYLPKGDGSQRPIGIPTVEDKLLQRAVVLILEPIMESEFRDFSYGFRPGRSAHQALSATRSAIMDRRISWVIDADLKSFFDTIDHGHLREMLRQRVRDGVLLRLIGKWLKAGVMEDGRIRHPDSGTPQGGVISPLLANLFLHVVLDDWMTTDVPDYLRGQWFIVRYADDYLLGFSEHSDAEKIMRVLPKRFARFGLTLHPAKTRLVPFARPCTADGRMASGDKPGSFDFLGMTHHWALSRRGRWVVKQRTAKTRLNRGLKKMHDWCRRHRHEKIRDQHRTLCQKIRGHNAYYGVTGNGESLARYRRGVLRIWRFWLDRRGGKRRMYWKRFQALMEWLPLPPPKPIHSLYVAKP